MSERAACFEIPSAMLALHFARIHHSYGRLSADGLICGKCGRCLSGDEYMTTRCPGKPSERVA